MRRGETGHEVGGPRSGGGHAHPHAPARAGVAVGRVRRRLLVPHQDVPQLRVVRQRVVERHDRAAGVPEHHLDPGADERAAQNLRP